MGFNSAFKGLKRVDRLRCIQTDWCPSRYLFNGQWGCCPLG